MTFTGWPVEAVEFYEGLEADNTKAYWTEHKAIYDKCVLAPMQELLVELEAEFGSGRVFRPYRDVRFSKDKAPYKLECAAHLPGGYVSFSADGLFVGSGLYMPDAAQLQRFRAAVASHEVLKTAPKGFPKDHPRIDLLRHKGIVMSKSWPVGAWLGTKRAKDRVVTALHAARPLRSWIDRYVG